ncbi:Gfo/Idh/MocA family oxidoreductase [Paenibacillus sp. IB182496]|uniref:Gfo/Idh/MocA family oxidoreductase n=1 Tax=Paenibacillus sabuli TaxID=2772509 RepID=A0A927BWN3_9BACL|nr:Gfo/Idh/MocA family oxidoreductase [Paenibacillus sabuli]MBD2847266.1 Gfo/Idh/MocA family oxidoreductase [Paenibacillus sabuli]
MIRVAKLSYWHVHAWDYTKLAQQHPGTEIVAVWDELPERGREAAGKLGVPFHDDLDALLADESIDAVIVDAPTSMHHEVIGKAARAGKHIFTEKVVAPTLREVNSILRDVEQAGVKLTVSLPRLYDGYTQTILPLIEQGVFGELTHVRVRLSHDGSLADWLPAHFYNAEQTGGGAMIDLGCHPMYLTRLFLGLPEAVSSNYGRFTGREVEDNAVNSLHYANGAIGIVEAGFVNAYAPFSIEIDGTEGSLVYGIGGNELKVRSKRRTNEWETLPLADKLPPAFDQWVGHIENGTEATDNIAMAIDLTKLMEASVKSAAEQRVVALRELEQ